MKNEECLSNNDPAALNNDANIYASVVWTSHQTIYIYYKLKKSSGIYIYLQMR